MCGILAYLGKEPALPILLEGLRRLEYRGYDSSGLAVMEDSEVLCRRAAGKIQALEDRLADAKWQAEYKRVIAALLKRNVRVISDVSTWHCNVTIVGNVVCYIRHNIIIIASNAEVE